LYIGLQQNKYKIIKMEEDDEYDVLVPPIMSIAILSTIVEEIEKDLLVRKNELAAKHAENAALLVLSAKRHHFDGQALPKSKRLFMMYDRERARTAVNQDY
jgi:hypothetical protein